MSIDQTIGNWYVAHSERETKVLRHVTRAGTQPCCRWVAYPPAEILSSHDSLHDRHRSLREQVAIKTHYAIDSSNNKGQAVGNSPYYYRCGPVETAVTYWNFGFSRLGAILNNGRCRSEFIKSHMCFSPLAVEARLQWLLPVVLQVLKIAYRVYLLVEADILTAQNLHETDACLLSNCFCLHSNLNRRAIEVGQNGQLRWIITGSY